MPLNAALEIAAFPFLLILAVYLKRKYTTRKLSAVRFRALVNVTLLVIAADVISRQLINTQSVPSVYVRTALAAYYILATLSPYCAMRYAIAVVDKDYPGLHRVHIVLLVMYTLFHIANIFLQIVRVQGTPDMPVQGLTYALATFGLPAYFMGLGAFFMIRARDASYRVPRIILFIGMTAVLIAGLLQTLLFVEHRIIFMVQPVALFCLFFAIELPTHREIERVIERLSATREQSVLSEQKAVQANRAKSDFLANTSHEIRTPMNAILGMNEMILRTSKDTETLVAARDIKSAGQTLMQIINDILDFSRIESGRMELIEAPYALSDVLKKLAHLTLERMSGRLVTFVTDYDETLPDLYVGDEERITQVLYNLLDNAVKYTLEGEIKLSLTGRAPMVKTDPYTLVFTVRDTGVGIGEKEMEKLFTRFERADIDENHTTRGAGLGLALSNAFAQMMGGDIQVASRVGEGTLFTVTIPQKRPENAAAQTLADGLREVPYETRTQDAKAMDLSGRQILVIDDAQVNLIVARGFINETNAHVDTAISGEACLEMAAHKAYDMILIDHQMPGMDGIETMQALRALKENASGDAVIVALTANAGAGAKERYVEAGFDDYLSKPLDHTALMELLRTYLK